MIVENRLTPLTLQDATRALYDAYMHVTGGPPRNSVPPNIARISRRFIKSSRGREEAPPSYAYSGIWAPQAGGCSWPNSALEGNDGLTRLHQGYDRESPFCCSTDPWLHSKWPHRPKSAER